MATMWRKAMVYLGLGPDDEYDDYGASPDERPSAPEQPQPVRQQARPTGTVRPRPPVPLSATPTSDVVDSPAVRPVPFDEDPSSSRVRAVPRRPSVRPQLVAPTSFNQAQDVADNFKAGKAVAMDLIDADRDLSRRLIDFSSGLCYGLGGHMEKVAGSIYLVTPLGVEVPVEERERLATRTTDDL
jgi:cell division inhibitor SepF